MKFKSISVQDKEYTIQEVIEEMIKFIELSPEVHYRIIVGTDSLYRAKKTSFSTAIIIHRVGKAAKFWYSKYFLEKYPRAIVPRIMKEVSDSIEVITELQDSLLVSYVADEDWEVHIDAGQNGESMKVVKEDLAYVTAMGFRGEAKPDSAIATNVADRFTKH